MPTVKNPLKAVAVKNTNASPDSRFANDTHGLDIAKLSSIGWHRLARPSHWYHSYFHEFAGNAGVGTPTLVLQRTECTSNDFFVTEMGYFFAHKLIDRICLICNLDDPSTAMRKLEQVAMLDSPDPIEFVEMKGTWWGFSEDYWEGQRQAEEEDYSDSETVEKVDLSEEEKKVRYGDRYAAWQLRVDLQAGMIGREEFERWMAELVIQRPEVAASQSRWPPLPSLPEKCN